MQHHPGSWYIPWGVPLQKMLTVPFNAAAAAGYHHQPQIATAAVAQAPQPGQPQPQPTYHHQAHHPQLLSNGAPLQYHHQAMHPAASAMFTPLTLRNLVGHPHHLHNMQQQQQQPLIGATHHQPPPPQQTAAAAASLQSSAAAQQQSQLTTLNINGVSMLPVRQSQHNQHTNITSGSLMMPMKKVNCIIWFFFLLSHPVFPGLFFILEQVL